MEHRRPGLIGPLILITVGVLFLLANLGMLPLSFWQIAARFWPLILILIGLEIIFGRRSTLGALLVVALWIAVIAGIIWMAYSGGGLLGPSATASEQLTQPLGEIKSAIVDLNVGVSTAFITPLASDATDLMQGTFRHTEGTRIIKTYNVVGDEGRLALREEGINPVPFVGADSRWDIALSPRVPVALRINAGVGNVNLDLAALNVPSLSINAGVSALRVTTPRTGATSLNLDGGVGSASITIPDGVAARIRIRGGLGAVRVNESRFPKIGEIYQSADYASASNKIDIDIDGGVGSVNIQ
jgi:hypothetical protein